LAIYATKLGWVGRERRGFVGPMAFDRLYPEMDLKVGLVGPGKSPAKWPFIQWLYALTTRSGELVPTSGDSQVSVSN
jgi:hypothetical protein